MEIAEPCCGVEGEEEEELTLTPHHTPSQSFDFIVWEKAYLDSIPAAAASSINLCTSISPLFHPSSSSKASSHILHPSRANYLGASRDDHLKFYLDKQLWVPIVQYTSSENDSTLMSCRTDADLPSCFFDYKPRISDGALTSLEAAVQSYAELHPLVVAPSPCRCRKEPRTTCTTSDKLQQLNSNHEALLRRSFSQPGGGSSKGFCRPTNSHATLGFNKATSNNNLAGRAVFGHPGIYHDQRNAGSAPVRNHTKMLCFPTSPGRRKHGQWTPDGGESTQLAGIVKQPTLDPHQQKEKHMSPACNPTLDIHLQQQNELLCTWADVMYMPAAGRPILGRPMPMQDTDYRNSFSDMSSLSSNYDHHAVAALNMSKLKLWGLHHRFKALCKKLCYTF